MKKLLLLAFIPFSVHAQFNITQLGHVDYDALHGTGLSNLWGYVDEFNNEYAIVGTFDGISIVDVTNPASPNEIYFHPGSNTIWREVKVYNNYAYVTTESNDGMKIINLNPLPGAITAANVTTFNGPVGNPWQTEHSLFIDENGILFVHGTDRGNGGVILYDLNTSPTNPTEIGVFDNWYVHDSYARGDTLYSAHITDGFFTVTDVSTPSSITMMSGQEATPKNFTHNCWLDNTGNYLFTTDEVTGAWIGAYDISDLSDVKEMDRIRNSETSGSIPHNTYWLNNYLVTSYYRDGVTIHDVTDPSNMILVGSFDTSPMSGDGFNGAWGVYPYFPSGNLIVSDMEEGMFILGPTYVRACYLEGNIKDAVTLGNLNTVQVDVLTTSNFDQSDLTGNYSTGTGTPGTYQVVYSKAGYISDTITVNLVSATTVTQDVLLQPYATAAITGTVTNSSTLAPIPGAMIQLQNSLFTYVDTTDASGNYSISPFFLDPSNDVFDVTVGMWGYETYCTTMVVNASTSPLNIALDPGYSDDFSIDLGWNVASSSSAGFWERAVPYGTLLGAGYANPNVDMTGDCYDKAYVTGNENNPSVGADDIDNGSTALNSPFFNTTGMTDPYISFYLWFRNGGGSGSPNDTVTIFINDGALKRLDRKHVNNFPAGAWTFVEYQLSDFTSVSTNLKLILSAEDYNPGHVVEAGIDRFRLTEGPLGVSEHKADDNALLIYPNPTNGLVTISSKEIIQKLVVMDLTGKIIIEKSVNTNESQIDLSKFNNGIYLIKTLDDQNRYHVNKLNKQ